MKALPLWFILFGVTCAHWSEREPAQSRPSHSNKRIRGVTNVRRRRAKNSKKTNNSEKGKQTKNSKHPIPALLVNDTGDESGKVDDRAESPRAFVEYYDAAGREAIVKNANYVIKEYEGQNAMVVEMDEETKKVLLSDNRIKAAQSDERVDGYASLRRVQVTDVTRAPEENTPWGIRMIQADQLPIGPSPVTVCIVDTGYDIGHPDLPGLERVTGDHAISKFGDLWNWKIDFNGHGTHLAGTIAALGNNNLGVVGAGEIPLHITRGLDDNSAGFESDIIDAVDQCVAAGAKIINLSLGGDVMSERARLKYESVVNQKGVMVVAAAGNQGQRRHAYPASHPAVISVAAVYEWGNYWEGSNYSDQVELAAPGHNVVSTTTTLSAVHSIDYSFTATQVAGSRNRERVSILFDCGAGHVACNKPEGLVGGICLMARDQTTLKAMISNCVDAGGVGAIIFEANPVFQQEAYHARVEIPVVVVTKSVGVKLLSEYKGTEVSLGFHDSDSPQHTYAYFQGTSMAVPHVVSAAALVWSYFPQCTNHEIRYALAVSAEDKGMTGCDWDYGHGIVKALDAKKWLDKNPCGSGNVNVANPTGGCAVTQ